MHQTAVAVAGMVIALAAGAAPAAVYKTFLLGGQSNMTGNGLSAELPLDLAAPFPAVRIFYGHQAVTGWNAAEGYWDDLRPGFSKDSARFGPEVTFGRRIAERWPGENIALVKYAKSSGLAADWQLTPPNSAQWDLFWQTLTNAEAQLAPGDSLDIVGMLWMQGEGDTSQAATLAYETNLTQFIGNVRARVGKPDLPFVIGQIAAAAWGVWAPTVQQAQANVAADVPHCALVTTDDLSRWSNDRYHYDTAGITTLGTRFGDAYFTVVPEPAALWLIGGASLLLGRRQRGAGRGSRNGPRHR